MLSQLVFFASVASAAFPSNPQFSVDPNNAPIFDDGEPNICRDGGGSGTLNGFKAIAFSDTYKNNADGSSQFFQANSFTYYGFSNPEDPRNQKELGDNGHYGPALYLTPEGDEQPTDGEDRIALWPSSNMVAYNDSHALGAAGIVGVEGSWTFHDHGLTWFTIQMNEQGIVVDRVVEQAYAGGVVQYGGFSFMNLGDGYMHLFGRSKAGVRVARTPIASPYDKLTFEYWDGSNWVKDPPSMDSTAADLFTHSGFFSGPYTGDVWHDPHHDSIACVFMESAGGTFWLTYPEDGKTMTGKWSEPIELAAYNATKSGDIVYAGHVHPEWDTTGATLLMSYSDGGAQRRMVDLTWKS